MTRPEPEQDGIIRFPVTPDNTTSEGPRVYTPDAFREVFTTNYLEDTADGKLDHGDITRYPVLVWQVIEQHTETGEVTHAAELFAFKPDVLQEEITTMRANPETHRTVDTNKAYAATTLALQDANNGVEAPAFDLPQSGRLPLSTKDTSVNSPAGNFIAVREALQDYMYRQVVRPAAYAYNDREGVSLSQLRLVVAMQNILIRRPDRPEERWTIEYPGTPGAYLQKAGVISAFPGKRIWRPRS